MNWYTDLQHSISTRVRVRVRHDDDQRVHEGKGRESSPMYHNTCMISRIIRYMSARARAAALPRERNAVHSTTTSR